MVGKNRVKFRDIGPQSLPWRGPLAAGIGVFEAPLEILADQFLQFRMAVQEFVDVFEYRIHINALANELEVCEADLGIGCSDYLLPQGLETMSESNI